MPRQRRAYTAHDGLKAGVEPLRTYNEIADELGISRARVYQHLQSALHKLRKGLLLTAREYFEDQKLE